MTQRMMFSPQAGQSLRRGADAIARALRTTLGPRGRCVAVAPALSANQAPELLDDGATIARRIIALSDPFESMGAMIVRQVACKMGDTVGDGAVTAAVLTSAILSEAMRHVVAGVDPVWIRRGVKRAAKAAEAVLKEMAWSIETPEEIAHLAMTLSGDRQISDLLEEIFDVMGLDGVVLVEESQATTVTREYVEGVQWDCGFVSPHMATTRDRSKAVLENPRVLMTDHDLTEARQLLPVMQQAAQAGIRDLFIMANDVRGEALGLLVLNKEEGKLNAVAVKAPGRGERRFQILEDIAILTGGQLIARDAGETVEKSRLEHLGATRTVWVDANRFNIIGGHGDPKGIRQRIAEIRAEIPNIENDRQRERAHERMGKLAGGVAILHVGAATKVEREQKVKRTQRTVNAIRGALEHGLVPGGGVAYVDCIPALEQLEVDGEEHVGVGVLIRALEQPLAAIADNSGHQPSTIVAQVKQAPPGWGFDVMKEKLVNMRAAGIVDTYGMVATALEVAVSAASEAITTEVLITKPLKPWQHPSITP